MVAPRTAHADDMGEAVLTGALIGAGIGLIVGIIMVVSDGDPDSASVAAPARAGGDPSDRWVALDPAPAERTKASMDALQLRF